MKLSQLQEKSHYEKNHSCKTPDAVYTTIINENDISVKVKLPFDIDLTDDQAEKLEADLHYAVEKVLSSFFNKHTPS